MANVLFSDLPVGAVFDAPFASFGDGDLFTFRKSSQDMAIPSYTKNDDGLPLFLDADADSFDRGEIVQYPVGDS